MLLASIFLASVLAIASVQSDICPDEKTFNALMEHTPKIDFTSLVADKVFIDVWRRKEYVEEMSCSMTKFSSDKSGHLRVLMHNVAHDGTVYKFRDVWAENKNTGTIFIVGSLDGHEDYEENMYLFYADENVYGYWACHPESYQKDQFWRAAVSVVKDKSRDDPAVQASLKAATAKMKQLQHLTGEMSLISQALCPAEFPVEDSVPKQSAVSVP